MNCIYLSGNSIKNKSWIEDVERSLSDLFNNSYLQYYKHWQTGDEYIDLEHEQNVLNKNIKKFEDQNYIVFAKSIGTVLTAKSIKENVISPDKCIFVGTPISWAREKHMNPDSAFAEFSTQTLFIQHTNDPICSSAELKKVINNWKLKNFKFEELDGDSHHYPEINKIKEFTKKFVFG